LHHVGLVIEHSSGRIVARCIAFTEEQITGLQLIQRSGVQYQSQNFGSLGSAICQLDSEPSTVQSNCFGTGPYWQYFHRTAGGWAQSPLGVTSWTLHDGDMDGWHYAPGAAQAPATTAFSTVCPPAAPVAAASSVAPAPAVARPGGSPAAVIATATPPAPATARPTPSPEALLTTAAASPQATIASASSTVRDQRPPGSALPILLFGSTVVALLGLLAWNFRRHAP
jgi:hypothetical protein